MLSVTAKKRILADIKNVSNDDMKKQGIFYSMNEADMTKGTALIIGPADTPYEGGFYFFGVQFPPDYPFAPPAMTSLTQDGITRFNPNMYREGKVCLSLLNTWHVGERWSGCQTLSSILLSIRLRVRLFSIAPSIRKTILESIWVRVLPEVSSISLRSWL